MIYVGYMDPLPSQIRLILSGSKIELDNKAIEAFKFVPKEEDESKELQPSELFSSLNSVYEGLSGDESIFNLLKYLIFILNCISVVIWFYNANIT